MELTFGEQIKIILKRKNMTIRMLAELLEQQSGKPMSRQNLTQKLNRDNFQEQDMKEIAQALGCVVQISVIDPMEETVASLQSMMKSVPFRSQEENGTAFPSQGQGEDDTMVLPPRLRDAGGASISFAEEQPEDDETMVLPELPKTHRAAGRTMKISEGALSEPEQQIRREEAGEPQPQEPEVQKTVPQTQETPAPDQGDNDVDSDVLKEIEMALMESIQKEISAVEEEAAPEAPALREAEAKDAGKEAAEETAGQTEEEAQTNREQEREPDRESEREPEYDGLAWARKKPAVWPRLIVPGEDEPKERTEADTSGSEDASESQADGYDPEFQTDEYDPGTREDQELIEFEELESGDISAVSAPYTLKRAPEETVPEPDGGEENGKDAGAFAAFGALSGGSGGDISAVSAPYVIPRTEEPEPAPEPGEYGRYYDIPLDEIPEMSVDDAAETVQEEPDMKEKMASWDAAVKRRLEQPILMPSQERRLKRDARQASGDQREGTAREPVNGVPDINPFTGKEYETNTVKHHPTKPDMLLVYDQDEHMWIEQAERAFNNFQIRKRAMLGRDYEPPVYLD